MSQYQKGKTNLDFTEDGGFHWRVSVDFTEDSEWQWHQLGHMQVCTPLYTDNHASTPPLSFFTGRMPFLPPNRQHQSTEGNTVGRNWHEFLFKLYNMACSGVTSHRQPRRCRGAQGPKTVKRGPKVTRIMYQDY